MNRQLHHQHRIRACIILFALWSAFSAPLVASAHGSEGRIELNVTQASPGATIDLRGSGFEPDDTATIMLVSAERQVLLGSVTADEHGDLSSAVLLPMDLVNGAYEVRVADMHHVAAAPLDLVPDSNGEEEGGQRGVDEPLLAPMPTQRAGTGHPSAVPSLDTATSLPTTAAEPPIPAALLFSSVLAIVILVAGLVVILRRFR